MSQQTTGRAALVANNLPTSKSINAATNATPIVVTTTTPHGVKVNEIIVISGVVGNAGANGTFIAGAVTSTTVTLTAYPAGTNVAGTGGYVSGGTLLSLGFGITVPVPNDLTDPEQATSVNVPFEACLDRLAYLMLKVSTATFPEKFQTLAITETIAGTGAFTDTGSYLDIGGCRVGDFIQAWIQTDAAGTATGQLRGDVYEDALGTPVLVTGVTFTYQVTTADNFYTMIGAWTVATAGTARLMLRVKSAGGQSITYGGFAGGTGDILAVRFAAP